MYEGIGESCLWEMDKEFPLDFLFWQKSEFGLLLWQSDGIVLSVPSLMFSPRRRKAKRLEMVRKRNGSDYLLVKKKASFFFENVHQNKLRHIRMIHFFQG